MESWMYLHVNQSWSKEFWQLLWLKFSLKPLFCSILATFWSSMLTLESSLQVNSSRWFPLGLSDMFGCRYEAAKRQWSHINDMFFIKNLHFDQFWLHFEGHGPSWCCPKWSIFQVITPRLPDTFGFSYGAIWRLLARIIGWFFQETL